MEKSTYGCFLPDLTRFIGFHCAGPNCQHHFARQTLHVPASNRAFNPAIADCGYRAPLTPHLARYVYEKHTYVIFIYNDVDDSAHEMAVSQVLFLCAQSDANLAQQV